MVQSIIVNLMQFAHPHLEEKKKKKIKIKKFLETPKRSNWIGHDLSYFYQNFFAIEAIHIHLVAIVAH